MYKHIWSLLLILLAHPLTGLDSQSFHVILAPQKQAVLSAEVDAVVMDSPVKMGGSFEKGETLIQLDKRLFEATLKKAKAQQIAAEAILEARKRLFEEGSTSLLELKTAEADAAEARADVEAAELRVSACTVAAPFSGKLVETKVRDHELVRAGQELVEIVDDSVLVARLLVPSAQRKLIYSANTIRIHIKESGTSEDAMITEIGPVIDPASSLIRIHAEIDNRSYRLQAGMVGKAELKH